MEVLIRTQEYRIGGSSLQEYNHNDLVPSSALPPWKLGHVNWEIILYLAEQNMNHHKKFSLNKGVLIGRVLKLFLESMSFSIFVGPSEESEVLLSVSAFVSVFCVLSVSVESMETLNF